MKILFLTTHFNTGGITSYIVTLSKELVALGHSVCVVSSGGNMVDELVALGAEHVMMPIRTKFFLSWRIFRAVPGLHRLIRKRGIDIIHSHTRVTHFLSALVSRVTGVAYVITYHGFYQLNAARRIFPCIGRKVISISDQVTAHLLEDVGVVPEKVVTIRNGIDLDQFRPASPAARERRRREFSCHEKKVVGVIARLADVKGHCFLIDAIDMIRERIPDVLLMIVGTGKEEQRLKEQVRQGGLDGYVRFFPVTNPSAKFLEALDCSVLPSLDEGLGMSIMEAQAMGLPVVASRVGGILSLIEDGRTGLLVAPGNARELSAAISRVLGDPDWAKSLGAAAFKKARCEYGADIMAKKIAAVYQMVIDPYTGK